MFNDDITPAEACTICGGYVDEDGVCRTTSDLYPCSIACECGRGRASAHAVPAEAAGHVECDECAGEIVRERQVEAMIAASPAGAVVEVSRLAVEAALGAGNLLNGGGAHPDDEDEDQTTEIQPMTNAELVYGVKGAA